MQQQLRDTLESAALRLDNFLDTASALGPRDEMLIAVARDIAYGLELIRTDQPRVADCHA